MIIFRYTIEQRERSLFLIKWMGDQPIYRVHEPIVYELVDLSLIHI